MRVVKHTALHVFVHLALFTALAMLIPIASSWVGEEGSFVSKTSINATNETVEPTIEGAETNQEVSERTDEGLSTAQKNTLAASILLIVVSIFFVYKIKDSLSGMLKSIGAMVFLPGALTVIFSVFSADSLLNTIANINWLSLLLPIANFYIHHSVPGVLSIASVYMLIGGIMYWIGNLMHQTKHNFNFQHRH